MTPPKKDITKPNTEADIERDIAIGTDFTELQSLNDANGAIDPDGFEAEIANAEEAEQVLAEETQRPVPESTAARNRRIAKNTLMLYIRMGIATLVGLYTGRMILKILGVEDFGIYGVVGSIVGMMGFLNASLSGATSRFIMFELGKGDIQKLKSTFASSLVVHISIAIIVLIVAETIGLWFLNHELVIPEDRMHAAHWVFQLSIITAIIGITQVPYSACIIAHEKMNIFAYLEILNVTLKLIIVFLLPYGGSDRLITYACLMLITTTAVALLYRWYCVRNFAESKFSFKYNTKTIKDIWSFSAFNIFSSLSLTGKRQGIVFLTNIFFGVTVNAAASLAATVSGIIQGFCSNAITAIRPQIIASYACSEKDRVCTLTYNGITCMVVLMCCAAFPFVIEMNYVLSLWLEEVPKYTAIFCQISLLGVPFSMAESVILIANTATGNIKAQSICSGILLWLQLPIIYALFRITNNPITASIVSGIFCCILFIVSTFLTTRNVQYISSLEVIHNAFIAYIFCAISCIPSYALSHSMHPSFLRMIIVFATSLSLMVVVAWIFLFNRGVKNFISATIKGKFKL